MAYLLDWIRSHETAVAWLGAMSIVTFLSTLAAIPMLVARIPADYFVRNRSESTGNPEQWTPSRVVWHVAKNLLGIIFVLAGLAMLVLPGQGVLTILIGVMLMNFSGKSALERRIVAQPRVRRAINWLRAKARKPPLDERGEERAG